MAAAVLRWRAENEKDQGERLFRTDESNCDRLGANRVEAVYGVIMVGCGGL